MDGASNSTLNVIHWTEYVDNVSVNSGMLCLFLAGIYTGVFPVSLYIYVQSRKRYTRSMNAVVIGSMLTSYIATVFSVMFIWQGPLSTLVFADGDGPFSGLAFGILSYLTPAALYISADGLLAWRAFHVCGRSFLLLIGTAVYRMFLYWVVWASKTINEETQYRDSVIGSYLDGIKSAQRRRYLKVVDVLIQSSAIYSVAIALQAIFTLVTAKATLLASVTTQIEVVQAYLGSVIPVIAVRNGTMHDDCSTVPSGGPPGFRDTIPPSSFQPIGWVTPKFANKCCPTLIQQPGSHRDTAAKNSRF
ncbi:hypothetical protein CPC08DRAFT_729600 [Agrocybe pediades]|nr:hypothetical protein CPC08DRAFT_729600 [Agrocybe pediades]